MKLQNIKITETRESKTNPRGKDFDGKSFDELVASVKEKGILTPILVRMTSKSKDSAAYEVIAGNRRLKAAKEAGLETIPAQIVEMTDIEAREAQIVENLQREDIHPLDEGEGYRKLIEESKYEIPALAAKMAKPESYIRQRLFLTNLITPAADAYRAEKINDGHAVLIAKLSTGDQTKTLQATTNRYNAMTVNNLKEWIEQNIYSQLDNQPWLKNPGAMEAVGECIECEPNRMSLFGDFKEGACTSVKCWKRKMEKYISWRVKEGKLAKASSEYGSAQKGIYSCSNYVLVAKKGKDRCKSVHGAIVVNGAGIGKEIEICTDPHCQTHRGMTSQYGLTPKEQEARRANRKKEIAKAKKAKADREDRLTAALMKVKWPISGKMLDALLTLTLEQAGSNLMRSVAKRHELKVEKVKGSWGSNYYDYGAAVKKATEGMGKSDKVWMIFELLIDTGYESLREGIGKLK